MPSCLGFYLIPDTVNLMTKISHYNTLSFLHVVENRLAQWPALVTWCHALLIIMDSPSGTISHMKHFSHLHLAFGYSNTKQPVWKLLSGIVCCCEELDLMFIEGMWMSLELWTKPAIEFVSRSCCCLSVRCLADRKCWEEIRRWWSGS